MIDVGLSIFSIVVMLVAMVVQPRRAQCPLHWHDEGVRPSGSFICRPNPVGDLSHRGHLGELIDDSVQPPGQIQSDIYCTGGSEPIVVDERTVGCQARH